MRCTRTRFPARCAATLMTTLGMMSATAVANNDCPAILPMDAVAISMPRLCQHASMGRNEHAVCREYSDDQRIYQVVFRGGASPAAVYELTSAYTQDEATAPNVTPLRIGKRSCDLERPQGVPGAATYRGTGICQDEQGQPLPCSLFEHAGARQPEAMRYFVYYEPGGGGIRRIDTVSAGPNERMLEAEMAFQLGQALANSICCRERSRAYLARAAALFPDDGTYRAALTAQAGDRFLSYGSPLTSFRRMLEQSQ
jgi:hypothetical protein